MSRIFVVLRFLELGGEWKYKNATLVWLENHVTSTLSDGTEMGIHGIGIKGESIKDNVSTPCYMGTNFDFNTVVSMIDEIPKDQYLEMLTSVTIHETQRETKKYMN